jgi:hypothetical protein
MESDTTFADRPPREAIAGNAGDGPTPISLGRPTLDLARTASGEASEGERSRMTLVPAPPVPEPERRFSWWKETGMDNRTVRYLIRDENGNHVATCGLEHQAQDLIDLLNFAIRAEANIDDFEAPLTGLREDLHEARVAGKGRVAIGRMNVRLDDIWKSIGRIRGRV